MQLTNWLQQIFARTGLSGCGLIGRPAVGRSGSVGRPATAWRRAAAFLAAEQRVECLESRVLPAISVLIDFSLDTNNFFADQGRRDLLQSAADAIGSRLTDSLTAISPSGSNSWTAIFDHPGTGEEHEINNRAIAANTVLVFAGGRNFAGTEAGRGGYGGFSAGGTTTFQNIVEARGQTGALAGTPSDFGPWGGVVSFDTVGTTWHFGATATGLDSSEVDFLTVAQHELAHLFGFGTADSWNNLVNVAEKTFTGAASKALNGNANVPLNAAGGDSSHWALSVTSDGELATMRPTLTQGERHLLTAIDFAGLDDLGWTVSAPPAPVDFGDAPDSVQGAGGFVSYKTSLSDNGPTHTVVSGLFLGDRVDGDTGADLNFVNHAETDDRFVLPGSDDEDGVLSPVDLLGTVGAAPTVTLLATNTSGSVATLFGWIDYDQDGLFENATERVSVSVPNGTTDGRFTLTFPTIPSGAAGETYARFRLSTDVAAGNSTGAASNGEVEDYRFTITKPMTVVVASSVRFASGTNGWL